MDDVVVAATLTKKETLLRRRNSISTLDIVGQHNTSASTATSSSSSFPSDDLEMLTIKPHHHSYTSLRDLLPSASFNSPKTSFAHLAQPGSDICIRNRLVKQAAWAYLQPMSVSPGPAGAGLFHGLWPRIAALFGFFCRNFIFALDSALRALRIRASR